MKNEEEKKTLRQEEDPILTYTDNVTIKPFDPDSICSNSEDLVETVDLESQVKLFAKKVSNYNPDCANDTFGFTLIFGNYGTSNYDAPNGTTTIVDNFVVNDAVGDLLVLDVCVNEAYELVIPNGAPDVHGGHGGDGGDDGDDDPDTIVDCGTSITGDTELKLRTKNDTTANRFAIDIPCHSICCASILLKIDPNNCPCED